MSGLGFFVGFVEDPVDPSRKGRARLIIPEFTGPNSISGWVDIYYSPGTKGILHKGDMVGVLVLPSVPGEYYIFGFNQVYPAPQNVGSLAPGADDVTDPAEYARTHFIEVDPANEEIVKIKVKGKDTAIEVQSSPAQIRITPGENDVLVGPGGARFALEGDPVQVNPDTGRGRIVSGSAQMRGRRIT